MVELRLYVEGGGDSKLLRTACRQGFSEFLGKAGLKGHMPRIVACGGRKQAYDDFCTALSNGKKALLLVDSEDHVTTVSAWQHLLIRQGDQWLTPEGASEEHCHLMVQCMESWFLADRQTLETFFGQGFKTNALPVAANPIESITKSRFISRWKMPPKLARPKMPMGRASTLSSCSR